MVLKNLRAERFQPVKAPCLALCAALLLLVCTGCPTPDQAALSGGWQRVLSLEELSGTWAAADGSGWEYPFTADGTRFLRLFAPWEDCTARWQEEASARGMAMEALWSIRQTVAWQDARSAALPYADQNGTEQGVKFRRDGGLFQVRTELLVPELVASQNLRAFERSADGTRMRRSGTFRFFSKRHADAPGDGQTEFFLQGGQP